MSFVTNGDLDVSRGHLICCHARTAGSLLRHDPHTSSAEALDNEDAERYFRYAIHGIHAQVVSLFMRELGGIAGTHEDPFGLEVVKCALLAALPISNVRSSK